MNKNLQQSKNSIPDGELRRRLPVGAEVLDGGVHFRLWAPERKKVEVVPGNGRKNKSYTLNNEDNSYFSLFIPDIAEGTQYGFRLDNSEKIYPDPVSRFQPDGPHGLSQVIDPSKFKWTDENWRGPDYKNQIIYEMHIGTFTHEGTWASAMNELPELASLGITIIEVMPIADFPGKFGWGYDGVDMFAPSRLYGTPDEFRNFVDKAHKAGVGVILDVVYNHLGPDGNYLKEFSKDYFTDKYKNEWGKAINFDGQNSAPVRQFFTCNAKYWMDEFHIDGLRLDATQAIFDDSKEHILAAITKTVRETGGNRKTFIVAENEPQLVKLIRPLNEDGYGMDALWNDDFHHSAMVAMTGHNEAYYTDYLGKPQEFISSIKWGYLYQGQFYKWQKKRRGTPSLAMPPYAFVMFIQNHDQVANSGRGLRIHELTSLGMYKAITALMILPPGTPMLFQGQEFAASNPFFYFADHNEELAKLVCKGRAEFLAQFPSLATRDVQESLRDPAEHSTFEQSKLDFSERVKHEYIYTMHKDLIRLKREDPVLSNIKRGEYDGAVLSGDTFVIRFFSKDSNDRLLLINLGRDLNLNPAPEPLLAPPEGKIWVVLWSSENIKYNGNGIPPLESEENWKIPGYSATLLFPKINREGNTWTI
jgi:maltooligosyltrehalose trehalohydrolase